MDIKKAKKVIVSVFLVSVLAFSAVFAATVAARGIAAFQQPGVAYCGGGYIDWRYYSSGDTRDYVISTYRWDYANAFSGVTIVSKSAKRSAMNPNQIVYGYITAKYGSETIFNNKVVAAHYFDPAKGYIYSIA